ncbi:MAG TPA: tetratricopeptide repeat protein [Candidatus Melainabacteria bacterium]|nr:tetratricopeptide repeat protein [Candidatus Melainabacteria bacterium]
MKQKLFLAFLSTLALSACSMDEWGLKDIVEGDCDDITPAQLQKLSQAIVKHPKKAEYLIARGRYYYYKDDYEKAIADFDKAIALDASHADWFEKRGDAYRYSNQFEKALSDYSRAIKLEADNTMLFTARGDCYLALHQHDQAEKEYTRAIELSDAPGYELLQRASFFEETGRLERAVEDYKKAVSLKEDYWSEDGRESLAKAYIFLDDKDKALSTLEGFKFKKGGTSSKADDILLNRAYLKELMGMNEDALISYRLALTKTDSDIADDDDPSVWQFENRLKLAEKAGLLNDKNERDKCVKKLLDAYQKQIDSGKQSEIEGALQGRALFLEEEGKPEEAKKDRLTLESLYAQRVKQSPKEADIYHDRGSYFADIKEHEKALADFREAAALAPAKEDYQEHIISELVELKRFEELESALTEGLKKLPDNSTMLLARARLLEHKGKLDEALAVAEQALVHDLYEADIHETIASILRKKGLTKEAEASEFKARFYKGAYEK